MPQRHKLARVENDLKTIQKEREQIFKDQRRLRENLQSLGQTSEEKGLRSRYIQQLDSQESRLGKIDQAEEKLKAQQRKQRQTLETLMGSLSMDLKIQ